jgi:hypothetical protein
MKLQLATKAKAINRELAAAEADFQSALQHALNAGQMLSEVKAQLPHGQFGPWVRAHIDVGEREARNYMRLAANRQRVADLPSIRQAVALLAEPKPEVEVIDADENPEPKEQDYRAEDYGDSDHLAKAAYMLAHVDWLEDQMVANSRTFLNDAQGVIDELGPDQGAALLAKSAALIRFYTIQRQLTHTSHPAYDEQAYDKLYPQVQAAWMAYRAACDVFHELRGEPLMDDSPLQMEDCLYHPALQEWRDEAFQED